MLQTALVQAGCKLPDFSDILQNNWAWESVRLLERPESPPRLNLPVVGEMCQLPSSVPWPGATHRISSRTRHPIVPVRAAPPAHCEAVQPGAAARTARQSQSDQAADWRRTAVSSPHVPHASPEEGCGHAAELLHHPKVSRFSHWAAVSSSSRRVEFGLAYVLLWRWLFSGNRFASVSIPARLLRRGASASTI